MCLPRLDIVHYYHCLSQITEDSSEYFVEMPILMRGGCVRLTRSKFAAVDNKLMMDVRLHPWIQLCENIMKHIHLETGRELAAGVY